MMQESFRILVHGGKVRVATPNLLKLVDLLRDDKTPEQIAYVRAKMDWHHWNMTPDPRTSSSARRCTSSDTASCIRRRCSRSTLEAAGFTQIQQYQSGEKARTQP